MDPLTAAREALAVHDAFHKACPHIPEIQEWGFLRAALDRVDELEAEITASRKRAVPLPPRRPEQHKQVLTTEDRDGCVISPTCAHCGKAAEHCTGVIDTHRWETYTPTNGETPRRRCGRCGSWWALLVSGPPEQWACAAPAAVDPKRQIRTLKDIP